MGKIFLAAPFTFNFESGFLDDVEELLINLGHSVTVPHDFARDDVTDEELREKVKNDLYMVESSDILLAEVTNPSHGVGMEILHANKLGKRIILLTRSGTKISSMVRVHGHEIIEYSNFEDLKQKLGNCLQPI